MYTASVWVSVNHHKQTVTNDYTDGIRDLFEAEAKNLEPNIDFETTWILGGDYTDKYISHSIKIYLYESTLFLDPEDFFSKLIARVRERSGKEVDLFGDIITDIPEEETRQCPSCEGKGRVFRADRDNNKVLKSCLVCNKEKRVPIEVAKKTKKYVAEFWCRGVSCIVARTGEHEQHISKTKVKEGVKHCDKCVKEIEEFNKIKKQADKETKKWMNQPTEEMKAILNHQQILREYKESR